MIRIRKGTTNIVAVTLAEKGTYPYYLLFVANDTLKTTDACIVTDLSAYPARYNEFHVTEKSSPAPTAGEMSLEHGYYHYSIYGQSSSSNLVPANATALLEKGRLLVILSQATTVEYDNSITYNTYNG